MLILQPRKRDVEDCGAFRRWSLAGWVSLGMDFWIQPSVCFLVHCAIRRWLPLTWIELPCVPCLLHCHGAEVSWNRSYNVPSLHLTVTMRYLGPSNSKATIHSVSLYQVNYWKSPQINVRLLVLPEPSAKYAKNPKCVSFFLTFCQLNTKNSSKKEKHRSETQIPRQARGAVEIVNEVTSPVIRGMSHWGDIAAFTYSSPTLLPITSKAMWNSLLSSGYKLLQCSAVLKFIGNCNTEVNIDTFNHS